MGGAGPLHSNAMQYICVFLSFLNAFYSTGNEREKEVPQLRVAQGVARMQLESDAGATIRQPLRFLRAADGSGLLCDP